MQARAKRWGTVLRRVTLFLPLATVVLAPRAATAASHFPRGGVAQPRALVLEPFGTELGMGQSAGRFEADVLQRAGYAVTVLRDAQVTVPIMRRLSDYSFVYIDTHVGPLPNDDASVATGDTRYHRYAGYFANYYLVQMLIADGQTGHSKNFDAVTGRFIHRYAGIFPPNSIVFVNSCNALDMPLFWHYLRMAGVSTLISWHHHVSSGDAEQASHDLLSALAQGETVNGALLATQMAGAGRSTVGKQPGWLSFSGDGSNTLLRAGVSALVGAQAGPGHTPH